MATGTITVFNDAKVYLIDGGWEAADDIKCAVIDTTLDPTAADVAPVLGDYTQVTAAGTYVAGGTSLGNLGTVCTQDPTGTMKFDSDTNPTYAADPLNDVDAYWGLIYHVTTGLCIAFVELGGPVDMVAGSLTQTWPATGIFTIT
jgi:hypothetical protein